jgi:lipopolysaccharide transport system permease protein
VMWNVIHPVVMIAVYILILGSIMGARAGASSSRGTYAVYLCAGIIPWLVFREILTRCSTTVLENASLIKKVAFPEIILHLGVLVNTLIIHSISYSAFLLILAFSGAWPGAQALACFLVLIAVAVFALGIGLFVSVLNIYFRDVVQVIEILLQFLFWFTPIVYYPSLLHPPNPSAFMRAIASLLEWNPLVHFVRVSQALFNSQEATDVFSWVSIAVVAIAPFVALAIGLSLFNRFKHDVLDNI